MTPTAPTLGLFGVNMGPCASSTAVRQIGALAEELGYDSLWAPEHVVLPNPRTENSPLDPEYPLLDPLITLALLAGHTERVRLATGIIVLPQRGPLVLAKELASLDVLSNGRVLFGFGVGYLEPELRALGVPLAGRGVRAEEYLAAMRTVWTDEHPEFHGQHVDFANVSAYPRPVRGSLPVIVGGEAAAVHRRAVRHADGWYGFRLTVAETATQVAALRAQAELAGRDLADLSLTVTPAEPVTAEIVREYANIGINRLALAAPRSFWRTDASLADFREFVRDHRPDRLGAQPDQH